ncbi:MULTISPECIES: FAD-dependent oxidoreductase [Shewanella]|jgi:2-octaprenylphenol hydroxylase|uniref:FAD-dependent oxidoreductase n=1 Tax=Shewanella vesiculosa TaxID=518738 RepID=A0ABV0FP40_9GAMM|nr:MULTISPECIES: FAD-dependent oxidoreductase [Shewanella]NCQ44225.1 FAD-dependent 2-octaprenylphenol hydroxylase [Shewanella frigidimarina]MBB1321510.1 FAD-dependent monooxygenase [Shewanella sp. SR43-8]MBB1387984.1 FAD-dependent monooxygenase [Shewanella sp. SG44-6]MBB1475072.1 FAD-dependent monooxygenase [Shewanella sp. SG41-3]NCO71152.1 FAD-dependent 2-octaprenylphenol hydroxylase [Shewanella vesiculosa]|tara:strand:+ start:2649 stop:3872 length:1224 start_codon:yes stop_codon:yes gene_type:complete
MFSTQTYDVAIVGGGMVGLATAIGLANADLNVVVIDAGETQAVSGEPKLRVSAVNKASQQLLENLGAWQYLDDSRVSPYQKMSVWDKDGLGKIEFDAHSISEAYLGSIIENDAISYALAKRASEISNLTHLQGQRLERIAFGEREAWLTLAGGDNISAAVVVAADGANSWVREQCNIPLTFWDYGHHAIVATVRTELAHDATARQAFLPGGPLAMLPLYDDNLCSIVWSVSPDQAEQLLALDDIEFGKTLTAALDGRLGLCQVISERQSFPLRMRYARHFARHRLVLAGDAAHTIHPLAGQGVNLGFLDAASIIDTFSQLHEQGKDLGEYSHLRALERWRKAEAMEMIATMEGFKRLFAGSNPLKKAMRDIGLTLVDNVAGLKTVFIKQAMGNKMTLPKLCREPISS